MSEERLINLDVNATYGVAPHTARAVEAKATGALNPSSIHRGGQKARALVENARQAVRELCEAPEGARIIFTSGASESNNTALFSAFEGGRQKGSLVISAVEHPSVIEPQASLSQFGVKPIIVKHRVSGEICAEDFAAAIDSDTRLVSVMLVNNETGEILPVKEICRAVKAKNPSVLVHCDAAQALGKYSFSMDDLGVDLLSISGHKVGGFTGTGALIAKQEENISPLIHGGPQESRKRAGTENLPGIVAFGEVATQLKDGGMTERVRKMSENLSAIQEELFRLNGVTQNFPKVNKVPNTVSVRVAGINANDLVVALDLEGVFVSSGAACASGKPLVSRVLLNMGLSQVEASESIRISVGDQYSTGEYSKTGKTIARVISRMRSVSNSRASLFSGENVAAGAAK